MKLALMADIHGNFSALQAVVADLPSVDRLMVAGDVLGYYPLFNQCLELLGQSQAVSVLGNHEAMLRGDIETPNHPILSWYSELFSRKASTATLQWLAQLPSSRTFDDMPGLMLCHGSPWGINEYLYPDSEGLKRFKGKSWQTVVIGHTHRQMDVNVDGCRIINPGSVGQPRDGDLRAAYALLDTCNGNLQFKRVPYSNSDIVQLLESVKAPRELSMALLEK